jgi:hypothetical protein
VDDNEEIPDIDDETVIGLDNVSMVNSEVLSQMQREDAALKNCCEKAFSHHSWPVEWSQDSFFRFFYT